MVVGRVDGFWGDRGLLGRPEPHPGREAAGGLRPVGTAGFLALAELGAGFILLLELAGAGFSALAEFGAGLLSAGASRPHSTTPARYDHL